MTPYTPHTPPKTSYKATNAKGQRKLPLAKESTPEGKSGG